MDDIFVFNQLNLNSNITWILILSNILDTMHDRRLVVRQVFRIWTRRAPSGWAEPQLSSLTLAVLPGGEAAKKSWCGVGVLLWEGDRNRNWTGWSSCLLTERDICFRGRKLHPLLPRRMRIVTIGICQIRERFWCEEKKNLNRNSRSGIIRSSFF